MPTFEIRYDESRRDMDRDTSFHVFGVRCGGVEERIAVGLTDRVRAQWRLGERPNAQEIESRTILFHLKKHLANVKAVTAHRILLTVWDRPDLGEGWTVHQLPEECPYEWKECRHQHRSHSGLVCDAHHDLDQLKGRTTRAACEHCDLPSTDVLCENLMYPRTLPSGMDELGLASRMVLDAQCDIRSAEFDRHPGPCVPGGRSCWVQTYTPEEPLLDRRATAAQFSVGDAIDQLNMAFQKRYGRTLVQIVHARSMEDLSGDCATDDTLQLKLQVLAGLLEGMQVAGLLTKEEAAGAQGTVDLLERLFTRDLPGLPDQHLRILRNINKLANAYPRHARVKNIERAHAELGLPYPLSDYPKAWAIIRETFIQTLRQLALHLS